MDDPSNPWTDAALEQNRRWLTAYVLSATADRSSCEDLVQEVFSIAIRKSETFQAGTNLGGWLRTIARNVILRHCEKHARQPLLSHDDALDALDQVAAESEDESSDPFFMARRKRFLTECLETLNQRVHRLLDLRYVDRQSSQKIAQLLGMSVSAVNMAALRARAALSNCIRSKEQATGI
jgi:RNA polymerase sigma factor (sigma-70 family)